MPILYKTMFSVSVVLMAAALALFLIYGFNLGIDFTGGSILEVEFSNQRPEVSQVREALNKLNLGQFSVSPAGDKGLILKMPEVPEEKHQEILTELKKFGQSAAGFEEKRFDSIGSTIGSELKRKSVIAIALALILISLYLAVVFSRIGKIINPFVLALSAVVALIHDLLLPIGVFSWLGHFRGVSIDAPLIAAALAILGYSINDTVVVYDRIRENVLKNPSADFNETVHKSIRQTLVRSINTTLTTLFAVISIYVFGGETLKNFSLALIIGIASGAYSSIFVASPILMMIHTRK